MQLIKATQKQTRAVAQRQAATDYATVTDAFFQSLDIAPQSLVLYGKVMRFFWTWVQAQNIEPHDIKAAHVKAFRDSLLSDGKSPYTACNYLSVVRKFYEWAEGEKYYPNVAKAVKSPKRPGNLGHKPLNPVQFAALIEATTDKRDKALLNLLGRTGMRTIEAARAKVGDLAIMDGRRVLRVHGKGRHAADNFVILFDKCLAPLAAYLQTRNIDLEAPTDAQKKEPLFASISQNSRGQAVTTRFVRALAREKLDKIGLTGRDYSAHSLRHTAGTMLYKAGATVQQIQATLRHASPTTSQIYFRHALEEQRLAASGEAILEAIF